MTSNSALDVIDHQERTLTFAKFDEDVGWALGSCIREWADKAGWPIVIDVRQFHRLIFFTGLRGSTPDNIEWARRKMNVVSRYHRSSYAIGQEMAAAGTTLEKRHGLPLLDYADHGGAFPIRVEGAGTIGCVTVSGLPQREDHMLVVRGLCEIQKRTFRDFCLPE